MPTASSYLMRLAERIAVPYAAHPDIRALILTGSAASGEADLHSDLGQPRFVLW